ncbi:MAG: hypothetical protein J6V80_00820 [Clostridia bacterium]|nr:hypothetical protein [Clostridia bacterium]
MNKRLINVLHMMNMIFQAFYTLLLPVGIGALISYLLTKNDLVDSWIWALLLTVGFLMGLYSMIKFILTATKNIENMERQRERHLAEQREKEEKQAMLRSMSNKEEDDDGRTE